MSLEEKIAVFNDTKVWEKLPHGCMEEIADVMYLETVDDGHIFVKEGDPVKGILIVQSGVLVRTKLSCSNEDEKAAILASGPDTIRENSVIVDEIFDTPSAGRVTGALHNFKPDGVAFATVIAKGPCKVWFIPGDLFRAIVSKPEYALPVMSYLAEEVREGSKSIRRMLEEIRSGTKGSSQDNPNEIKVLCYDATSWVTEGFKPAVDAFNQAHSSMDSIQITMDYTTERLSEQSATFAAGTYICIYLFIVVCIIALPYQPE
mmetsp:Transcript_18335/g.44271  ORF Transcript_18335/g.44271 Transcript_18335/m.44271 type:complete len:261 (-) Transcript_18335:1031-1813(-)